MTTRTGDALSLHDQRHALAAYVHRYTGNHRPQWSSVHLNYPVQFKDDRDWLKHTRFHVRKDGRLDQRFKACESSPTWPNGRAMRTYPAT